MPELINDTTFEVTLPGGDKVEIGDKESTDFKPHIKLNRWDGECFIKVKPANLVEEEVEYEVEGDKVKCKYKVKYEDDTEEEFESEFYALEPRTVIAKDKDGRDVEFKQCELGGFEFETILKKKPETNKIVLNIETQGLTFHYQPPLTQKEIDEGRVRPDNVVGSYAVFHATKTRVLQNRADAEKYKAGKAFHIYCPKITDANGDWVWGDLSLDEQAGILTVGIDPNWLDNAVYPVTVDPTFGWVAGGGSSAAYSSNYISGLYPCAPASSGTVTKLTVRIGAAAGKARPVIYKNSDDTLVCHGAEVNLGTNASNDLSLTGSVVGSTEYILCIWLEINTNLYWDSHATYKTASEPETYHSTNAPPSPCGWLAGKPKYNEWIDIYCTYTEVAVGQQLFTLINEMGY